MRGLGLLGILLVLVVAALLLGIPHGSRPIHSEGMGSDGHAAFDQRLKYLEGENAALRREIAELVEAREVDATATLGENSILALHPVPDVVSFCGETLPLENEDARVRFEEEWIRFLVNRHWLINWQHRSQDIFPVVEAKLREAGLPEDLKYVLVIESGVDARATSSAGAAGWWQFIQPTGKRYGLARNQVVDERRDLALSTDAAIRYFRDLQSEFQSWPLSLSAYNAGERRVREALEEQGETSFYDLVLPRETEAYWFKAAAAKALLEDPDRHGLGEARSSLTPVLCDTLEVQVTRSKLPLREVADLAVISYRELKRLNPSLRTSWLPRGSHRLILPSESVETVVRDVKGLQLRTRAEGRPLYVDHEGRAGSPPGASRAGSQP